MCTQQPALLKVPVERSSSHHSMPSTWNSLCRSSSVVILGAVQRGMAQHAYKAPCFVEVQSNADAVYSSPRREAAVALKALTHGLFSSVGSSGMGQANPSQFKRWPSAADRANRQKPSTSSPTSLRKPFGRGRILQQDEAPSRSAACVPPEEETARRSCANAAAAPALLLQQSSQESDASSSTDACKHHVAEQSLNRDASSAHDSQPDSHQSIGEWDSIRTFLSSTAHDQLTGNETGSDSSTGSPHGPVREGIETKQDTAWVSQGLAHARAMHTQSASSSMPVRPSSSDVEAVESSQCNRRRMRRAPAVSEQDAGADNFEPVPRTRGKRRMRSMRNRSDDEVLSTPSGAVCQSSDSVEAEGAPDVWQMGALSPSTITGDDCFDAEEVQSMHGANSLCTSEDTPAAAVATGSNVDGDRQLQSSIEQPAVHEGASNQGSISDSMLGLGTPPLQSQARAGAHDERLRMREEARQRAVEALSGRLTAQGTDSTQRDHALSESTLANTSPLFQVAPPLRARRKGRPFEPYIPPVQRDKLQKTGLVWNLLHSPLPAGSGAAGEHCSEGLKSDTLRCISEPCSMTMSTAPEQAAAAQYMHVRPVCQHATWNLSASSLLGQLSTDRLQSLIASMCAYGEISDLNRTSAAPSPEHSSSAQASASFSVDTHGSRGSGADDKISESVQQGSGGVSWADAAQGRNELVSRSAQQHTSERAAKTLASAAGAEKWACWKTAVGVAQALYAKEYIEEYGQPPKIVPNRDMMPHGLLQSADQDSEVAEHMLHAYWKCGNWHTAQCEAQDVHARKARLRASQRAPLIHKEDDAVRCELERERQRRQVELDSGSTSHDVIAGDHYEFDRTSHIEEDDPDDEVVRDGLAPLPRKPLDLAVLDSLWNQAAARGVGMRANLGVGAGTSPVFGSVASASPHHNGGEHNAEIGMQQCEHATSDLHEALGDCHDLVQPPEWGTLQLDQVSTHGLEGLEESMSAIMHDRTTAHQQHIDDEDEQCVYEHDRVDYEDMWPRQRTGTSLYPVELPGSLSLDGLRMAPDDVGIDAFQSSYSPICNPEYHVEDDGRCSGVSFGAFEPHDPGSPSGRSFAHLP